jgi:hypothetical protein
MSNVKHELRNIMAKLDLIIYKLDMIPIDKYIESTKIPKNNVDDEKVESIFLPQTTHNMKSSFNK